MFIASELTCTSAARLRDAPDEPRVGSAHAASQRSIGCFLSSKCNSSSPAPAGKPRYETLPTHTPEAAVRLRIGRVLLHGDDRAVDAVDLPEAEERELEVAVAREEAVVAADVGEVTDLLERLAVDRDAQREGRRVRDVVLRRWSLEKCRGQGETRED